MTLLDTWAWVEYFDGTPAGQRVRAAIEKGGVATCIITFAELADFHERDARPNLEECLNFMASKSEILPVTRQAAVRAGKTKWAQREKGHKMGLADAIIYEVARLNGRDVLTGDEGFTGLDGVTWVKAGRR